VACSAVVLFLIAVPVVLRVVRARKLVLQGNSPVVVVPCTPRATSPAEGPREQLVPASASALVLVRVLVSEAHAPEWVAPRVLFLLRGKRLVRSGQVVVSSAVAVSNTRRPRKAR